jgi:hypothetical protein
MLVDLRWPFSLSPPPGTADIRRVHYAGAGQDINSSRLALLLVWVGVVAWPDMTMSFGDVAIAVSSPEPHRERAIGQLAARQRGRTQNAELKTHCCINQPPVSISRIAFMFVERMRHAASFFYLTGTIFHFPLSTVQVL